MNQLTFRGTVLKHVEICRPNKGGVYVRIQFTSEVTDPVLEAMGWDVIPECIDGAKLSGLITSQKMILTPADKELKEYEVELEASEVTDFQLFRVEKKDDSVRTELRFVVRTNQSDAETYLGNWMRMIGGAQAALKISYEAGSKQETLPMCDGEPEGEKDTGCIACNNDIPLAGDGSSLHSSGSACTRANGATTEAVAAETMAKARRGRKEVHVQ